MSFPLSGAVFIRDNQRGAFALWESVASWLPLVDEMIILDLGSTDGTLELLQHVAANPKIKVLQGTFPIIDAGAFATLANDLVEMARNDNVVCFQADEVPHQVLLTLARDKFAQSLFDWSLWRIQYRENFQMVKWFPHLIHSVGQKGRFHFVGDGMTTDRTWDAPILSNYGGAYFPKWGEMGDEGIKSYVNEMVTDISLVGAFRDNIPDRRRMHAPFWRESDDIEGVPIPHWITREASNPNWTKTESPFDLPQVLRWHVGRVKYEPRQELIEAIRNDNTALLVGLEV